MDQLNVKISHILKCVLINLRILNNWSSLLCTTVKCCILYFIIIFWFVHCILLLLSLSPYVLKYVFSYFGVFSMARWSLTTPIQTLESVKPTQQFTCFWFVLLTLEEAHAYLTKFSFWSHCSLLRRVFHVYCVSFGRYGIFFPSHFCVYLFLGVLAAPSGEFCAGFSWHG